MKKIKIALAAGAFALVLSACGQTESAEETQEDAGSIIIEKIDGADEVRETQSSDLADTDAAESTKEEPPESAEGDAPETRDNFNPAETPKEEGKAVSDEQEAIQNQQSQTKESTDAGNSLFEAFLKNEVSVANPYVEGMNLTVMDDKNYESEFEDAQKKYAYVDVNADDNPELIFKISSDTSELMYILGICDNELICFDVFESHTRNISFSVYDYGLVWEIHNYDGFEETFYSYTADGQQVRARYFTEENEADLAAYEGEEPEWIAWEL